MLRWLAFLSILTIGSLIAVEPSAAEIKTITATGEYRMGDNDTRADAKRLALQDAKRLALEKAGTYLESVTEIKNLQVTRDELRAYTAGILEITEVPTPNLSERASIIIRVDVTVNIDVTVTAGQINAIQNDASLRAELTRLRDEMDQVRTEVKAATRGLKNYTDRAATKEVAQRRRQLLTTVDVDEMLAQAEVAWITMQRDMVSVGTGIAEMPTAGGRQRVRTLLTQALSLDPGNPWAHSGIGLLLIVERRHDDGLRELREAVRLKPDLALAHSNLGSGFLAMSDLESAIAEYREALRLKPGNASTHNNLGYALHTKGELAGAIAEYRKAILLQPNDAMTRYGLGSVLHDMGDLAKAIAEYREALRIKPTLAEPHYYLGAALESSGDLEGAIEEYRTLLRFRPNLPIAHHSLGHALHRKADLDGAIAEYRAALRLDPDYTHSHFWLASALMGKGLKVQAAQEFREYLKLSPDTPNNRALIDDARTKLRELEQQP